MKEDYILESSVLAACINNNEVIHDIKSIITKDSFFLEKHQILWELINEGIDKGFVVDSIYLIKVLKSKELFNKISVGYLTELSQPVTFNHIQDARLLHSEYLQRQLQDYLKEAYDKVKGHEDAYLVANWLVEKQDKLFSLEDNGKLFKNTVQDAMVDLKERMESIAGDRLLTGTSFDNIFDFSPDEFVIIAAMSKAGKTKNLIYVMSHLLKANPDIGVKWFSLEDNENKIVRHFSAIDTNISMKKMEAKNEGEKLSEEEYQQILKHSKTIEDHDVSLVYGSYNVEKVSTEALSFVKKRKNKHNIIIVDNFNILVDGITKGTQIQRENEVAGALHQLRIKSNEKGFRTTIIILDHLNKSIFDDGLTKGFRPTENMLKGSGKKSEIMTQLVFINKPNRFQELMDQYKDLPEVKLINGYWKPYDILDRLTIYEVITSRNGACKSGDPIRYMTDLDTMEFTDFEEMKIKEEPKRITKSNKEEKENNDYAPF